MKRGKRILIGAGCLLLLLVSWLIAVSSKSAITTQKELMAQAAALVSDGIYIRAVPLLEEAAGYNTELTITVEEELKKTYIALIDTRGFRRKYTNLLEAQMSRSDASPEVFAEAANYYIGESKIPMALEILRNGIEKTGSGELTALYEQNRYAYEISRATYEDVASI